MNCFNECSKFFKDKTQENLGVIFNSNSCANCLYWQQGQGRVDFQYSNCSCNDLINTLTNGGMKMDVKDYDEIKTCLTKGKECGVLYSNWTNTEPSGQVTEYTRDPMYFNGCNKRFIGNQGSYFPGVF